MKFIVKGKIKYNGQYYTTGAVVDVKNEYVEEFKKFGWEIVDEEQQQENEPEVTEEETEAEEEGEAEEEETEEGLGFTAQYAGLTKDEIKQVLTEKGIKFPATANKAELLDLIK